MSTVEDMPKFETWKNDTSGRVSVLKMDRYGQLGHELIRPGQTFTITEAERLTNSDKAASKNLDYFRNGMLTPVRLIESAQDFAEIKSNPNLLSENDLCDLFTLNWQKFDARLKDISNALTLRRLVAIAESDEVNVTVRQLKSIKGRLEEVEPTAAHEVDGVGPVMAGTDEDYGRFKPIQPR